MTVKVSNGAQQLVPGLAVRAGQLIAARYRVEELLGSGPSGVVLACKHVLLRSDVTLKILASYTESQSEVMDRRIAKARRASRLKGVHVARIVDIGLTDDAMPYVASERITGVTIAEEMEARGRLPVEEAVRWVLEACEGLAEAHAFGLVHGDLKPQNLFLAEPTKKQRAALAKEEGAPADTRVLKILDFGSTNPLDAMGEESASAFFGSPAFLSPEQIQDPTKVDARADVWALGALLFHLTMGHPPFEADTLSGVLVSVVYDAPALLTEAPYELAKIVARCLEKDASKRPADVAELAALLAPFAGAYGVTLARRVAIALDAPTPSARASELADVTSTGSISPMSVDALPSLDEDESTRDPIPLVTRHVTAKPDDVTRPSRRVASMRAQREKRERRDRRVRRAHLAALLGIGAAAGLALASFVGEPPPSLTLADTPLPSLARSRAEAEVPAFVPSIEAIAADEPKPEPEPAPLPRTMFVPTPTISLARPAVTGASPPAPAPLPPSVVSRRRDEEYFRKLFVDRK